MNIHANYLSLDNDTFLQKIYKAERLKTECCLCAHQCAINRSIGELGFCRAGKDVQVASWQIHRGEEPPLAEKGGAGAIFFEHCNFECVYCQNFQISQQAQIRNLISAKQLSLIMLKLQMQGAQNIDLVSPTHFLPQIIKAIYLAKQQGLCLPVVYNTNAYESKTALELLDGIVDVYLPDFKYFNDSTAFKYSGVKNYLSTVQQSIRIMYGQVGDFTMNDCGSAGRGLLVRHLVLPEKLAGSFQVFDFLKRETGVNIGLSIMSQYSPCYKAQKIDELNKKIDSFLYDEVVEYARVLGFKQCWTQEIKSSSIYLPDFDSLRVFNEK